MLVEDLYLAALHVHGLHADVLVHLAHLVEGRLGRVVGEEDAVHAEHAAVGLVAEVASVGPVAVARLRVIVVDGLVHPVPDGGAAEEVGRFDGVPVVHQVAHGVAHRVGVLRHVEGVLDVVLARHGSLHPGDGRILVRAHVHDVIVALVLHGARGVEGVQGLIGCREVLARSGLVAQRPDDHRGMVDVGVGQLHDTGHVGGLKLRHVRERRCSVVVLVALDVGLVLQVDAVLVAGVVPVGVAGIVRVAHVVDVAALHQHHFFRHLAAGDGLSGLGTDLLPVHAFQLHRSAVDVVVASCQPELVLRGGRVLDFHLAEAEGRGEGLHHLALLVLQLAHQGVAVGSLRRPLGGLGHVEGGHRRGGGALQGLLDGRCSADPFHQGVLVGIEAVGVQLVGQSVPLGGFLAEVTDVGLHTDRAVGVGGVQVGEHTQVAHLYRRGGGQGDGAEDARQPEHVLRFEEGAVGVAVHLGGHHVLTLRVQVGGDVERGGVARVLREAHVPAVHPEVEERGHAVEVDIDFASGPSVGHGEVAAV